MSEQDGDISVEEAKRRMLEWSAQADAEMHAELMTAVEHAKQSAAKMLPWATGAAVLLGLLGGKRRKGRQDGREEGAGMVSRLIGIARTAIKVGTFALPLVRAFMSSRSPRA